MNSRKLRTTPKQYTVYLIFMLIACSGAVVWQVCLPNFAEQFTSWGSAFGWQREIALWNIGIITAIIFTLVKKNVEMMKLLTIQSTILCWLLGINHLAALLMNFSFTYTIHILGVFEVMLLGGIWGTILLIKART